MRASSQRVIRVIASVSLVLTALAGPAFADDALDKKVAAAADALAKASAAAAQAAAIKIADEAAQKAFEEAEAKRKDQEERQAANLAAKMLKRQNKFKA